MYTMLMGLNKMKGFVHQRVDEFLTEMFKLEDLYTNQHKTENMPFPKYLSLCYQASSYAREKAMPILLPVSYTHLILLLYFSCTYIPYI